MPEEFSPILLENLQIRWSGFRIRRIALNQHMPRVERLSEHVHRHRQILLYLRGSGTQHLAGAAVAVRRGSLLVISPGQIHRFEKSRAVRPICLAIDFEATEAMPWREQNLVRSRELALIERLLVELHERQGRPDHFSIQSAALILQILACLESTLEGHESSRASGPYCLSVEKTIVRLGFTGLTPALIAVPLGRTLDHLNRQLRAECGLTVGALLDRARLDRSSTLLRRTSRSIGEIGSAIGMDDQNYFARWFRRKTGQSPTRWREAMREPQE